jgi:hypothetical protein
MNIFDRVAMTGVGGTIASFGLSSLDSLFGSIAGLITIIYMCIKLYQEVKNGKKQ